MFHDRSHQHFVKTKWLVGLFNVICLSSVVRIVDENLTADAKFLQEELGTSDGLVPYDMPSVAPWERRYYRQNAVLGLEVYLVRKQAGTKWVVVKPDMTLALLSCTKSRTVLLDPEVGITWRQAPILTDVQKLALDAEAEAAIRNNSLAEMPKFNPKAVASRVAFLQGAAWLAQAPGSVMRFLRYSLRSGRRTGGLLMLMLLIWEVTRGIGISEKFAEYRTYSGNLWTEFKSWVREWDDEWAILVIWMEGWAEWISKRVPVWKMSILGIGSLGLIYGYWIKEEADSSQGSSTSSVAAPGEGVQRLQEMKEMMNQTANTQAVDLMRDMLASQKAMREEMADYRTAQRAQELCAEARRERDAEKPLSGAMEEALTMRDSANQQIIRDMATRLQGFEEVLREHAGLATRPASAELSEIINGPVPAKTTGEAEPTMTSALIEASPKRSSSSPPLATPEKIPQGEKRAAPGSSGGISHVIKRIKDKAMLPQQIYLEQLNQYEDIDQEFWCRQFPENYRERMAAEGFAEIYSHGMSGEQYGRQFLRERELLDCHAAREIVAGLAAFDSMMMIDQAQGLLNKVSTEKLARKIFGLIRAYENCRTVADWSRPKGKEGGAWKSKVDWDQARRIDPFLRVAETTIRVPCVEDEIRRGMTQDATILQAKQKLLDAGGGKWDPGLNP